MVSEVLYISTGDTFMSVLHELQDCMYSHEKYQRMNLEALCTQNLEMPLYSCLAPILVRCVDKL
jgi:hypothetical protein